MTRERDEEIDRFEAVGEDGAIYTVIVYQTVVESRLFSAEGKRTAGPKRLLLLDGSPVNSIDGRTFKVVATGEIIKKL